MASTSWYLYIAIGRSGALYTGISTDPERRVREHNTSKRGAKWARGQRPIELLCSYLAGASRSQAQREEARVKYLNKSNKQALIREKVGR